MAEFEEQLGKGPLGEGDRSLRPQIPPEWQEHDLWLKKALRALRAGQISAGTWPEGTPQLVIDLDRKTGSDERLLWSIFGDYPSVETILARTEEEVKTIRQKEEQSYKSHRLLSEQVDEVLNTLSSQERRVLQLSFGLIDGRSRTPEEIAAEIGVESSADVKRIEGQALQKLRHPSRSKKLKDYLV